MKLLDVVAALAGAVLPRPAPLSEEALERHRWIAATNARAAQRRAQREAAFDALVDDRPRWIPRRASWLAPRRER